MIRKTSGSCGATKTLPERLHLCGHQHRVRGLDHREIAHAGAGDQATLGVNQAVRGPIQERITAHGVARTILRQLLPECLPRAEV